MFIKARAGIFQIQLHGMRAVLAGELKKTCRRVDIARGANGNEHIALLKSLGDPVHRQWHFAEPDHVGTQVAGGATAATAGVQRQVFAVIKGQAALLTANLQQFAMHVQRVAAAGAFMQIVYILGHQQKAVIGPIVKLVFQARQRSVCRIGPDIVRQQQAAAGIVEVMHHHGLAAKPSGVATSSIRWFSHKPSLARKVWMPDSAETPAPVSTTIRRGAGLPGMGPAAVIGLAVDMLE